MTTPIPLPLHTDTGSAEGTEDSAEARMRQALGKLGTARPGKPDAPRRTSYQAAPGTGRHRFRQDGEVPVVRISLGETGRGGAHQAHTPVEPVGTGHGQADEGQGQDSGKAARQVLELAEQLRATQTRLGHAELALSEAGREAQARQKEATALRHALDAAGATLAQVRVSLATSERAREELERHQDAVRPISQGAHKRSAVVVRRGAGRPLGSTSRVRGKGQADGSQPVKWWTGD